MAKFRQAHEGRTAVIEFTQFPPLAPPVTGLVIVAMSQTKWILDYENLGAVESNPPGISPACILYIVLPPRHLVLECFPTAPGRRLMFLRTIFNIRGKLTSRAFQWHGFIFTQNPQIPRRGSSTRLFFIHFYRSLHALGSSSGRVRNIAAQNLSGQEFERVNRHAGFFTLSVVFPQNIMEFALHYA